MKHLQLTPAGLLRRMPEAIFVEEWIKPAAKQGYPFNDLLAEAMRRGYDAKGNQIRPVTNERKDKGIAMYSFEVYKGQGGWWFRIINSRNSHLLPHVDGPFKLKRAAIDRAVARTARYNRQP